MYNDNDNNNNNKNNISNDKHAYAGELHSFTHPRALLVHHDRGINVPASKRSLIIVLHIQEPYWYSMTAALMFLPLNVL
jgi:hypothetical protein